ncbi:ABC transporter permease [Microbacterium sp. No. 7]|uniref:ABC transporter permease n=1 Tax=Microbacterium sp. No. 7 TaxID=1714373 RepID=UPI0006CF275D|nr:ABC transporter permease [Microbacterium sp. No. 7]ALJ18484.1 hypothetical protein AOA12_00550 [Microbacterium sp. No. 7]
MNTLSLAWLVAGRARGGRARLIGTAAGVAVGVALLLLVLAAYNGLTDRAERSTWTYPYAGAGATAVQTPGDATVTDGEVLVSSMGQMAPERFGPHAITRVAIASTPGTTVEVPGVGAPPAPGTAYVSPALAALIASVPADQLGDRFGTIAGLIADDALASPDSLVAVVGVEADAVAGLPGTLRVRAFQGTPYPNESYRVIAIVGGIAVLFPVVVLIGIVTRLGSAARAERFAALRLMGATPHRVASVAAIETGASALAGAVGGLVLFWALVPVASLFSIEDGRFFAGDLHVDPATIAAIVAGTVLVASLVAYVTARRADLGPLGASRERAERRPRLVAVVPLLAGVAGMVVLTLLSISGRPLPRADLILVGGFVVVAVGLVLAGPVLTAGVSRLLAAGARGPAGVLAANRILRHPRATFRTVSGLVLAVFVVSVFAAGITTARVDGFVAAPPDERLAASALVGHVSLHDDDVAAAALEVLAATPGVTAVALDRSHPDTGSILRATDAAALGLAVPDAEWVRVDNAYFTNQPSEGPVAVDPVPADVAAEAWISSVIVLTDGSPAALERARTALLTSDLAPWLPPSTREEDAGHGQLTWAARYAGLANVGILIATVVSAISLAVSTIAGVLDRRRTLGLLRLTGMPASALRRMLAAEAAIPLATVFVLCVGLGFVVAWTLLAGLTGGRRTVSWPDPDYYVTIAVSLALAAIAIAATFRTARRRTALPATRFE